MKKALPFVLFSLLVFSHCKTVKYSADKLPERRLVFGDGGGFAGIETSYILLENGQVFKQAGSEGGYVELPALKANEAKPLFEKMTALQLYKLDFEKPGNLYYFLREVNAQTDSRVVWGAGDSPPPQNVVGLYKELKALVANRKPSGKSKPGKPVEETPSDTTVVKW